MYIFTNDFWGFPVSDPSSHKSYRPVTMLSLRFWPPRAPGDHPPAFHVHASNAILHGVVSVLVGALAWRVFAGSEHRVLTAAIAAMLFALHPIHTDAVRAALRSQAAASLRMFAFLRGCPPPSLSVGVPVRGWPDVRCGRIVARVQTI
jgi:hypothetical protein